MSEGEIEKPKPTIAPHAEQSPSRPFAYRALCKVAGILTVLGSLPALAASILGLFALATRPQTPWWAYALMAGIGGFAFVFIGLGSQILKERVWAAAVAGLVCGYFTLLNLTKDRLVAAACSALIVALCLAIVIAAWRLHRSSRTIGDVGETA